MKYFIIHIVTALLLFTSNKEVRAQELSLGQQIPDLEFDQLLNYSKNKLRLSELKDKLIIFDFWSFYCANCIKNFQKIELLQEKYHDKIQIILVNKDNKEKTINFFKNRRNVSKPKNIPLITNDTVLNNMFEHIGVPYYAWVNPTGKFIYSTHEAITPAILDAHFRGEKGLFERKSHTKYTTSLFEQDYTPYVKYGTILLRGIDSIDIHLESKGHQIASYCTSIEELYQIAYNESDSRMQMGFREHGRTILEITDKEKYRKYTKYNWKSYDSWRGRNGYYYESILPDHLKADRYKIMQEDLRRYFGLQVSIEKRPVKCLAVVRTSTLDKLKTKGGKPSKNMLSFAKHIADSINYKQPISYIRNKPIIELINKLRILGNLYWNIKVIDLTNYKENIDFEMKKSVTEIPTISYYKKALNRYDLDLVEKEIIMDVLILRE
ncbi:redoxin domain-containing protein [Flavihumibacter sp. CACIAM 22H1]|uniref:TlpA family protein disulfide reductase n=1 Tax=Flavihumibacter sp. CACIAM 22H1 TaxID=1812911 RepID=UPI0007A8DFAF|nr:redoxin domain-containing protein [Flavihumibacter sp. CACIAM 22H1]KYP15218.1 MAG: hypothetical protein A1D16_03140 [Flavihumibacter sp. CACIAM 22H1]